MREQHGADRSSRVGDKVSSATDWQLTVLKLHSFYFIKTLHHDVKEERSLVIHCNTQRTCNLFSFGGGFVRGVVVMK